MKNWYATWEETKRNLFSNEPEDSLGNIVRKYFDRQYEYEAHEWHRVVVTPDNKDWAVAQIKENEEQAIQSVLMAWEEVVCESREGVQWHNYGWGAFLKNLRKAYSCVKMDRFGNTNAAESYDILNSCLTFDGVFDFEWRIERLCDFVVEIHGGSVPIVRNGVYMAEENECELRLLALQRIMRNLHDNAVVFMTISGMKRSHGISLSKTNNEIIHNGVFECDRTISQIQDALPESDLDLVGMVMEQLRQINNMVERGESAVKSVAANSKAVIDEMKAWRGYIKQLVAGYDGQGLSPSPLTLNKMQAVFNIWTEYSKECKRKHVRPTLEGCLDEHGGDMISNRLMMIELVPTAKALGKIIHNMQQQSYARAKKQS